MSDKPRISFTVTLEEKAMIEEYISRKKRWRTASDLARDSVWQFISRNAAGRHDKAGGHTSPGGVGAALHRGSESNSQGGQ